MLVSLLGKVDKTIMWEVFRFMERSHSSPPNNYTFNSILQQQTTKEEVQQVLKLMDKHNIKRNVVTYNILISLYGTLEGPSSAFQAWQEMHQHGVQPNDRTWIELAQTCCLSGDLDSLDTVINSMKSAIVTPSIEVFTILFEFFGKRNLMQQVLMLLQWLRQNRLKMDIPCYVTLIGVFGRAAYSQEVEQLISEASNQWNTIPIPIVKQYCKSVHQLLTDGKDAWHGIGDIHALKSSLQWFHQYMQQSPPDSESLKLYQHSIEQINNDLFNTNPVLLSSEYKSVWSPFSYFFSHILPNPKSTEDIQNMLHKLHSTKPQMSPLLPSVVCILESSMGIFVGFTLAVPPKYRQRAYQSIFENLPSPLQVICHQWTSNTNVTTEMQQKIESLQEWLKQTVKRQVIYTISWNSESNAFLTERGMCVTCHTVFSGLQQKVLKPGTSTANYLMHCAEWEAVAKLLLCTSHFNS